MSRKKAAEIMNTWASAVSFYTLKHLELQSSNRKTIITHNNFRHCRIKVLLVLKTTFLETAVFNTEKNKTSTHRENRVKVSYSRKEFPGPQNNSRLFSVTSSGARKLLDTEKL